MIVKNLTYIDTSDAFECHCRGKITKNSAFKSLKQGSDAERQITNKQANFSGEGMADVAEMLGKVCQGTNADFLQLRTQIGTSIIKVANTKESLPCEYFKAVTELQLKDSNNLDVIIYTDGLISKGITKSNSGVKVTTGH